MDNLFKKLYKADKLQSKINKKQLNTTQFVNNHKRRRSMRKAQRRTLQKVKQRIHDCHHKISKYLVQCYDAVLLPKFETSQMIKKGERKLRCKSVRQMCTWSHYKFRQIINAKCKRYGCHVVDCDEPYTSKTCSNCGNIKYNLKAQKSYDCAVRKSKFDRDFNGARNIMIKFLCKYKQESVSQ